MKRLLAAFTRLGWRLAALSLIVTALYVALGRELVPLVAEYRLELEDLAREHGVALRIGRLEGRWEGLAPIIVVRDVAIGEGSDPVHLDQLRVTPDVLASLWHRAPRLAHVELEGLQLQLREQADGRWRLEGLPRREGQPPADPAKLLEALRVIERVSLTGSRLLIEPRDGKPLAFTYINLSLHGDATQHHLEGQLVLPDGQPLTLHLTAGPAGKDWQDSTASLYLSLPQSDWSQWLPPRLTGEWKIQALRAGGELWLDWSAGSLERATARLRAPQLRAGRAGQAALAINDFSVDAFYSRKADGFELILDSLALNLGETRWGEVSVGVRQRRSEEDGDTWVVKADRIDLAPFVTLGKAALPLPEKASEVIEALNPRGVVANVQARFRPSAGLSERLHLLASLERIAVGAYLGSPALENVSGRIEGGLAGGELRVDSEDFSLHLDKLFPEPWRYRRAKATLNWQYDVETFSLSSPYLQVIGEEGPIAGDFMIRLIRDPQAEDYMDLRVGIRDGDAAFTSKYLPTRSPAMSAPLAQWLQSAVRAGRIDEGWFQYQGSLNKGAAAESRSMSMFFKVREAELAFQPGWPALREARGEVFIEDSGVRVLAPEGRLLDSLVRDVVVDIPRVPDKLPRLALNGQVSSSLQDALQLLQQAPTPAAEVFAGWKGEGPLQGTLRLDIPLSGAPAAPARVQVDFATSAASLQIATPRLALERLSGSFSYDTHRGLSAADIRARAFGEPVRARAQALGTPGAAHTRLNASGRIAYPRLAQWLGVNQPLPLEGSLPYELQLDIDGADSQLRVDSSLEGLAINLPEPFFKAAGDVRPSVLRMTLQGAERRYWFEHGEIASLTFAAPEDDYQQGRGELHLGGVARLPGSPGLRLRGAVATLDWDAWRAVIDGRVKVESAQARRLFAGGELRVGRFVGFGSQIDDLQLDLARAPQGWSLGVDSAMVKGQIGLPDSAGQPIDLDFLYLKLPSTDEAEPPAGERVDVLADVDPRALPALDVRIHKLWLGERPVGGWSFKLRPDGQGAELLDLSLGLRGALLTGSASWQAGESMRTRYRGSIEGTNVADVLRAWDFAPSLSSRRFTLNVDGEWPGSPAAVSLKGFSGVMGGRMDDGQVRQVETGTSALRVFGLLNFDSLGRRLRLDFSDMFSKGLSYDRFRAVLIAKDGIYHTDRPVTMQGPSSNFEMEGQIDMHAERIEAKVLVTLPVSNNLPLAALIAGAPAVGGALFIADKLLGDEVARFASVQYDVRGPLLDPKISFDKPFEKPQ